MVTVFSRKQPKRREVYYDAKRKGLIHTKMFVKKYTVLS